jgi:hypothetical protein
MSAPVAVVCSGEVVIRIRDFGLAPGPVEFAAGIGVKLTWLISGVSTARRRGRRCLG